MHSQSPTPKIPPPMQVNTQNNAVQFDENLVADFESGNPSKDETHYWSEYRRSYEHALRQKMELERQKLKQETTEVSAGPPSGTKMSYQQLKQKFLRGNFENPSSLWAHDFGG